MNAYQRQGAEAHARAYIAAQTGSAGLGLQYGEVYEIPRPRPLWRRLMVLCIQFAAVAAAVAVACALVSGCDAAAMAPHAPSDQTAGSA